MGTVIDQRGIKRSGTLSSKQRFYNRNRKLIKDAIDKKIGESDGFTDIGEDGVDITVPKKGNTEPEFRRGQGGIKERVLPGNKEFNQGDRLPKPPGGGGRGREGSPDGEGDDDFTFHLNKDEFLDILFHDLALPNLTKVGDSKSRQTRRVRAGIAQDGPFSKLDMGRSMAAREQRLIATRGKRNQAEQIRLLEEKKAIYTAFDPGTASTIMEIVPRPEPTKCTVLRLQRETASMAENLYTKLPESEKSRIDEIDDQLADIRKKLAIVPSFDENDLRFHFHKQEHKPISKAVMFCLMDVSASMDEQTKTTAKKFYWLLHQFLMREYDEVDIVYIRHTQTAREVDEHEFFHGRETGGTVVSSAHDLMQSILNERYSPSEWNIYGAQASDGDNIPGDNPNVEAKLGELLPSLQGYFYTEITDREHQGLWQAVGRLCEKFPDRCWRGELEGEHDIVPVFREFFKKRGIPTERNNKMAAMQLV